MVLETRPWDAAEFLTDIESIVYYIQASLENSTAEHIAAALATAGRALGGVGLLAQQAHVDESELQEAIDKPGTQSYWMAQKIMKALQPVLPSKLVA